MYTDEGSTDVLMESNLCYRTNRDPFHQHYGRNNTLRNNILAYGGDAVLAYGKPEPHLGLTFDRNIFLSGGEPILQQGGPDRWTPEQTVLRDQPLLVRGRRGAVPAHRPRALRDPAVPGKLPRRSRPLRAARPVPQIGDDGDTDAEPGEKDWREAHRLAAFVTAGGHAAAAEGDADVRMLRRGEALWVRGRFARPTKFEPVDKPLWSREHVELFLRPAAEGAGCVQLGVASDGEAAAMWHACEAPGGFGWHTATREIDGGWEATLRIPLDAVAAAAGGDGGGGEPAWRFLLAFGKLGAVGDFASWQAAGHDAEGRVVDPGFADPAAGDFRLSEDSPALALGFVPWDYTRAGPRPRGAAEGSAGGGV